MTNTNTIRGKSFKKQPRKSKKRKNITSLHELKISLSDFLSLGYHLNEVQRLELCNEWSFWGGYDVEISVGYNHKSGVFAGYCLCFEMYNSETGQKLVFSSNSDELDIFIKNLQKMYSVLNKLNRLKPVEVQEIS